MPRGHNCHSWKYLQTTEGKRAADVFHYECRHCGATRSTSHRRAPSGCIYRQLTIDFQDVSGQLQRLNARTLALGASGALPVVPPGGVRDAEKQHRPDESAH